MRSSLCRASSVAMCQPPRPCFSLPEYVPITGRGAVEHELADSDIVCFVSRPAHGGACRSLIAVDEALYRLPPCATVTLLAVHEPGEWEVGGIRVRQRLFVVSVSFGV